MSTGINDAGWGIFMGVPKVAVIVRYGLNPTTWRARHARGEVVDETPYAYHLASSAFELEWSTDAPESPPARWWRMTVRSILGFDFVHVWRNRQLIARADAVWTHTEREHLAVALLKMLGPRRYPALSIAQSVWLWDLWPTLSAPRRAIFARLLRRHRVEVVLSRVNRDFSRAAVSGREVARVPFGTHFARPRTAADPLPERPTVLVIGNDRHRDWNLLRRVTERLPHLDFDVYSLSDDVRDTTWPHNVRVRSMTQRQILENAYATASVVALPLRKNRHASGCTVAIEAVSAGVPVVASDAGGIDEYVADATSALVPVDDDAAFADAIERLLGRDADPEIAAQRGLSEVDYIRRLTALTNGLLDDAPRHPGIERFERMEVVS